MINFEQDIRQIYKLIGGGLILPNRGTIPPDRGVGEVPVRFLAWDTRKIHHPEATIFVALSSGSRDGHDFIKGAFEKGVRRFWVEKEESVPQGSIALVVPDTLKALQELAGLKRREHEAKFFGITGSNGKTIVKEWLKEVLEAHFEIGASPGSFNSQLGVALSLLQLPPSAEVALIEAGISQPGEMDRLTQVIQPRYGIMTHFGDAHAEGFSDERAKLGEKLKLFSGVERVFVGWNSDLVREALADEGIPFSSIGIHKEATIQVVSMTEHEWGGYSVELADQEEVVKIEWGIPGNAARDNILLVILVARFLGLSWDSIQSGITRLHPVSMRMEMITDNPEITIINDAYNADRASVINALAQLQHSDFQKGHILILSDLEHLGKFQREFQQEVLSHAVRALGEENIFLIGPQFFELVKGETTGKSVGQDEGDRDVAYDDKNRTSIIYPAINAYLSIEDLIADFDYEDFRNRTVLLKGARRYQLERLIPYLSLRANATQFRINLDHLRHNFAQFRAALTPGTKMMAMVKAFAYGSGDWEVAQALSAEGIDYLAVAYTSAGIALRTHGVTTPIMVMNADPENIPQLFRFNLEPAVYGFPFLRRYLEAGQDEDELPLHLKVDTGMSRLGFLPHEADTLGKLLAGTSQVRLKSIMSHLSMADESSGDAYTHEQATKFTAFADKMSEMLGQQPLRHLVNTAGIIRFPEYHFDMVRLGLGLYGSSPVEQNRLELREVGSLHSVVTQVHTYPKGQAIGYGGSEVTGRESRVATVAIGYADGIRRSLSNGKMSFLVRGQRAPVIGRVCMDMLMLDVTDIVGVGIGDEVVLIGQQGGDFISVREMAEAADTIPYEVLVNIGQRVRRVYVRE